MRKKFSKVDTEKPSVPRASEDKSTLKQATSVLPLQRDPRASSPSIPQAKEAQYLQPDLCR